MPHHILILWGVTSQIPLRPCVANTCCRYLNYGLTLEELQSNKPIIGIAQTGMRTNSRNYTVNLLGSI